MRAYVILFFIAIIHTLPLWNTNEFIAGGNGDAYTHAAIGEWFCRNVVTGHYDFSGFMAPFGVSVAGNYDSPFPFILTCPAAGLGAHAQFHLFTFFQVLLILVSAMLLARHLFTHSLLRWAYVVFVWFCGFYIDRAHVHVTLLSVIWGFQFSLYALLTLRLQNLKSTLISFSLLALSLAGTFQNIPGLFPILAIFSAMLFVQFKSAKKNIFWGMSAAAVIFLLFWGPMLGFTFSNVNPVFNPADLRIDSSLNLLQIFLPFQSNILVEKMNWPKLSYEQFAGFDVVIFLIFVVSLFHRETWQNKSYRVGFFLFSIYLLLSSRIGVELLHPLFDFYPLKLVRAPNRFSAPAYMLMLVGAFLFLQDLKLQNHAKKWIYGSLFVWAMAWGPLLNRMWFFPRAEFRPQLPMQALEVIKNDTSPSAKVVMLPSAWAADPMQNFLRLFHAKPITSAYLAYPIYNEELVMKTSEDNFLSELACGNTMISYKGSEFMRNRQQLKNYLLEKNYNYIIINKNLLGPADCAELKNWTLAFLQLPWVKVLQETKSMIVTSIK